MSRRTWSSCTIGFVGAIGVLAAATLWSMIGALSLTLTLLTVAFFLTLPSTRWSSGS